MGPKASARACARWSGLLLAGGVGLQRRLGAHLREETDVRAEAVMWADLISGGACDARALRERWLSGVMGVECWRG